MSLRLVDGGDFIFGQSDEVPAVWGQADRVAWAKGESLVINAPAGVGKTTLAQQIALYRIGARAGDFLGMPLEADTRRVMYLAADRPRQIARSFRRMVNPADHQLLDRGLIVQHGPLPFLIDQKPDALLALVHDRNVGTLIVDSLKDLSGNLVADESGIAINRALQLVLAAGIEVVVLHHQRKAQAENRKPRALSDVYGSTWITAGAGSVLLLWGDPGDLIVDLTHLKQPLSDIGPLTLRHDHDRGITVLDGQVDLLELACGSNGVTARDAAIVLYGKPHPERNEVEKVRRRFEQLVLANKADRLEPQGPGEAVIYYSVTPRDPSRDLSREGSRTPHAPNTNGVTAPRDIGASIESPESVTHLVA